jgi:hypothetical protein
MAFQQSVVVLPRWRNDSTPAFLDFDGRSGIDSVVGSLLVETIGRHEGLPIWLIPCVTIRARLTRCQGKSMTGASNLGEAVVD